MIGSSRAAINAFAFIHPCRRPLGATDYVEVILRHTNIMTPVIGRFPGPVWRR